MQDRRQLERSLTMRLGPTARAWQGLADEALASLGISESAGRALAYLDRLGPDTRQGELARAIGISEPSLVPTIQALVRAGFVLREPDKEDRRAWCLRLTEAGAARAAVIDERLAVLRAELLEGIPEETLSAFIDALDAFRARIGERRGRA
jgi:MarR family transcriptional regulator for hemolysin